MSHAFDLPALQAQLCDLPGVVIAFSGGVDSTVLLAAALDTLGHDRVLAVIADSPSLARIELKQAQEIAASLGASLETLITEELDDARYQANSGDRCFWCKEQLFLFAEPAAKSRGWALAYGENADDVGEDRPGARSAQQRGVLAPLRSAGWSKAHVRAYAASLGLSVADKPAAPCLASRIAVGVAVDLETLERIEAVELKLRKQGYEILRARHLANREMALEFGDADYPRAKTESLQLQQLAHSFGYTDCSIRRYQSGSVA